MLALIASSARAAVDVDAVARFMLHSDAHDLHWRPAAEIARIARESGLERLLP